MTPIIDTHFLIKILQNKASTAEMQSFEKWLNDSDANKEEFGTLVLLWKKVADSPLPPLPDQNLQWGKIYSRMHQIAEEANLTHSVPVIDINSVKQKPVANNASEYGWILKVAAVLIVAVAIPLFFLLTKQKSPVTNTHTTAKVKTETYYTITAGKGERKTILLGDGSLVYLNVDSKLIYPEKFTDSTREVELFGEGYFSITRDVNRPFKVTCSNTVTVVKGTEFNIKSRHDLVRILITKGNVETFQVDSDRGIKLKKGEMITFDEKAGFSKPIKANIDHYLAWRQGKFSFSHTSLQDVMDEISRFYNVDVEFRNPSEKSKIITGVFDADSLEHIFSIISLTLDVKINLEGSKVIVQ